MAARRRQRVVQGRRDHHLDDGLATPSERSRVAIGAIHIAETRAENNSRGVMIAAIASGQRREARQLRERDVDPECSGGATPSLHAPKKGGINVALSQLPSF